MRARAKGTGPNHPRLVSKKHVRGQKRSKAKNGVLTPGKCRETTPLSRKTLQLKERQGNCLQNKNRLRVGMRWSNTINESGGENDNSFNILVRRVEKEAIVMKGSDHQRGRINGGWRKGQLIRKGLFGGHGLTKKKNTVTRGRKQQLFREKPTSGTHKHRAEGGLEGKNMGGHSDSNDKEGPLSAAPSDTRERRRESGWPNEKGLGRPFWEERSRTPHDPTRTSGPEPMF